MTSMATINAARGLTLALAVAACGGPTASSSPSSPPVAAASPSASAGLPSAATTPVVTPSAAPTATTEPNPTPADKPLPPEIAYVNQFVMRVAVTELNVRRAPSKSAGSSGNAPGRNKEEGDSSGKSGSAPGQNTTSSTVAPGKSGNAPGRSKNTVGSPTVQGSDQ